MARGCPGDDQDEDDDDDRDRLEQDPAPHPHLRLLAGQVLALGHRNDAADQHVDDRGHRQQQKDKQADPHASALVSDEGETKGKLGRGELAGEGGAVDAALAHRGERRGTVALGETPAVGVRD